RYVGVEADPALGRPARDVVLDAEAFEHADAAVVHHHRQPLDRGPAGTFENVHDARVELEPRRGFVELPLGVLERIELAVDGDRHGSLHALGTRAMVVWDSPAGVTGGTSGKGARKPRHLKEYRGARNARTRPR